MLLWIFLILAGILLVTTITLRLLIWQGGRDVIPVSAESFIIEPSVEAVVERLENGQLRVRWQWIADLVTIYADTSPNTIPTTNPLAQVTYPTQEIILTDLFSQQRYYFKLVFRGKEYDGQTLIVAERFLPLDKGINFRDIGGYRIIDGKQIRWGQVYRTGAWGQLSDEDLAYLANIHIQWVCDLRSSQEVQMMPDRMPASNTPVYWHKPSL